MCGVVGLVSEKPRADLGLVAAELLRTLEYRGYDSTGAAVQDADGGVRLLKGVGAPSVMVHRLGIVGLGGVAFCGQVRWATFGAVTDENSQPHVVRCHEHVYGAHNGNVTNCDALKTWLTLEGHRVLSDNDGEMVVHTVEHFFARELSHLSPEERASAPWRRAAMRRAIGVAATRLEGSFAAVVIDPPSRTAWAVKQGSSLYFGFGRDGAAGGFGVASSDLSSVLKLTRVLVPLREGEFVEYDAVSHAVWTLHRGGKGPQEPAAVERPPKRSRLRADDTALVPPFASFMEQEIDAQEATLRGVVDLFRGGTDAARALRPFVEARPAEDLRSFDRALDVLRDQTDDERMTEQFRALVNGPAMQALLESVPSAARTAAAGGPSETLARRLVSGEAGLLGDLLPTARDERDRLAVRLLDVLVETGEQRAFDLAVSRFADACDEAVRAGRQLVVVCCGSSYHAARAAAAFFAEMAHVHPAVLLPGEFRGPCARSLRDGDVVVAISQSGETKDLIDAMNEAAAGGRRVRRVAVVNNVNSTLAQEKSDIVIPLRCGPETAVPATKSFTNQMAMLYGLALALAERRCADVSVPEPERQAMRRGLDERRAKLARLPALVRATLDATAQDVDEAAQMLHLRPSIHILGTAMPAVAMEGALKVREVVLNHTQGYETSEFKHGPNTILGLNTVYGPHELGALLRRTGRALDGLLAGAAERSLDAASARRLVQAAIDSVLAPAPPDRSRAIPEPGRGSTDRAAATGAFALAPDEDALFETAFDRGELHAALRSDYPLVYVTGPAERDVLLTVSAINTHKIRGSATVIVAEDDPLLRGAAERAPADNPAYRCVYIALPRTGDGLLTAFTATVALQRLALRMSLLKKAWLDRLGIPDHGVHPDVPKNVSKSITVD